MNSCALYKERLETYRKSVKSIQKSEGGTLFIFK